MQIKRATALDDQELARKLSPLHYFQEIRKNDENQFRTLIFNSRFVELQPGEFLMNQGDSDQYIYFLMKGALEVCADNRGEVVLGTLMPGEVFGETAVILGKPRTAYIRAPDKVREAQVFATDFGIFQDLRSHQLVTLQTKLIVYRQMVHVLRWRNDQHQSRTTGDVRTRAAYGVLPFSGKLGTQAELESLVGQARYYAERLQQLNEELGIVRNSVAG